MDPSLKMIKSKSFNKSRKHPKHNASKTTKQTPGLVWAGELASLIANLSSTAKINQKICKELVELVHTCQKTIELFQPKEKTFYSAYVEYCNALKNIKDFVSEANTEGIFEDIFLNRMGRIWTSLGSKHRQRNLQRQLLMAIDNFQLNFQLASENLIESMYQYMRNRNRISLIEINPKCLDDITLQALTNLLNPTANTLPNIEWTICLHQKGEFKEAFENFKLHAKAGNPIAQFFLGYYLYTGNYGVVKDENLARAYFSAAADQGLASAQFWYAQTCVYDSIYDPETAMRYLKKAAGRQDPYAMFWYADILYKGEFGQKRDLQECRKIFKLAKIRGHPLADTKLKYLKEGKRLNSILQD
ncbi:hypothetical protein G9A89_015272 [Geosiphon pyriformis]|nr:hypothetical protein G9A89_015272 [Geosiphon pyriformis]